MNNTADNYSSRKISNTPSKKGVFEMNSNSNSNSNEVLNVNNLFNVNESSTFLHADDSTNLVHRMKESNEKKKEEDGKSSNKRKEDDPSALALGHPPKKSDRAIKCLTIAA